MMVKADSRLLDFDDNFQWMQEQIYDTNEAHGFHQIDGNVLTIPTKLALVMTEVAEAIEAHRSGDEEHMEEELADIVIRVMDLAESQKINLGEAIWRKALINQKREYKHGGKRY